MSIFSAEYRPILLLALLSLHMGFTLYHYIYFGNWFSFINSCIDWLIFVYFLADILVAGSVNRARMRASRYGRADTAGSRIRSEQI